MGGITTSIAASLAGAALVAAGAAWSRLRRGARLRAVSRDVTARHARLLRVKRNQLVVHDGYGNRQLQPWIDHVDYFIAHVILREARASGLSVEGVTPGTARWSGLRRAFLETLAAYDAGSDERGSGAAVVSGADYETLCRDILQAQGWRVAGTPVTGDQGADLIAEAAGCRVVIQCKFYGKPVGNKAVQEAFAAITFHGGHRGAVVSNAAFTRSARLLARANGVLLLHHDELADLARLLREPRETA